MKGQSFQIRLYFIFLAMVFVVAANLQAQPVITNQPVDTAVNIGSTATFNVAASGTSPLTYQWWFAGTTTQVGSGTLLTLNNVQTNQAGGYFVVVTNSDGSVTSQVATLTVLSAGFQPAAITNQPVSVITNAGATVMFTAGIGGSLPMTVEWWFNGSNAPVGQGQTLALRNVQANQVGNYWLVVSNAADCVTSSIVTLTVTPVTPDAPYFTNQLADVTTNIDATVRFTLVAKGSTPLRYHWWFTGTNVSVGTQPMLSLINVQSNQAGGYFLIVTNTVGSVTSRVATLTVYAVPATNSPGLWLISHTPTDDDVLKLVLNVGKNYRVQSSPDMSDWSDVTNFFSDVPLMYVTNAVTAGQNGLYYRLVSP
jgi:hypothetical protein